jgi:HEAT repeat protein
LEKEGDCAGDIASLFEPWSTGELLELMGSPDEEIRRFGCMGASDRVDPLASDALIAALGDPSSEVRSEAIHGLGLLRDKKAVQPLCGLLKKGGNDLEQMNVLAALERIGDPSAIPAIRANEAAMGKKNTWKRQMRLGVLLSLGDKDALQKVIQSADQGDEPLRQRRVAREACRESIKILGRFKVQEAVPILLKALRNEWHPLREEAAIALGEIGDPAASLPLVDLLRREHRDSVSDRVVDAIAKIGDVAVVDELADIIDRDFKPFVSRRSYGKPAEYAARALLKFNLGPEIDGLLDAFLNRNHLHDSNAKIQEAVQERKALDPRFTKPKPGAQCFQEALEDVCAKAGFDLEYNLKKPLVQVGKRNTPDGVAIRFQDNGTGMFHAVPPRTGPDRNPGDVPLLIVPIPFSTEMLRGYLHECSHARLGHVDSLEQIWSTPVQEVEADLLAMKIMTDEGVELVDGMATDTDRVIRKMTEKKWPEPEMASHRDAICGLCQKYRKYLQEVPERIQAILDHGKSKGPMMGMIGRDITRFRREIGEAWSNGERFRAYIRW